MTLFGFIEYLPPGSGILRMGPEAKVYSDPFDFAVVIVPGDGNQVIAKGLVDYRVVPRWLRWMIKIPMFTRAYHRACKKLLAELGHELEYERHNHGK